ncbi:FkbM family methyltransferase [Bradyrhizobium sp. GM5.1]
MMRDARPLTQPRANSPAKNSPRDNCLDIRNVPRAIHSFEYATTSQRLALFSAAEYMPNHHRVLLENQNPLNSGVDESGHNDFVHAHRFPLLHEKHTLRELLVYLDVDCVFDVGANEGQYAELLRSIGYDGQIVSFEPVPRLAKALRAKAVYDASWYVESVALDSTRRHVEFNVASSHSLSSLHTPLSGGVFERDIAASERIGIDTATLDDYFRKYQKTLGFKRTFLKMDTQGHDLSVAAGAGEMLSEFYGLQSEVAIAPLYQDQPSLREAVTFYEERGFAINAVLPRTTPFPR